MSRRRTVILLLVSGVVLVALGFGVGYAAHPSTAARVIPRTPDEWVALGTWLTALVALGAAVVALSQATEARRLRIEQAQPYVVCFMEQNRDTPLSIELVIRNTGKTPARNVAVTSEPALRRTDGASGIEDVWLPSEIPYLAPDQEWRTVWDISSDRHNNSTLTSEDQHHVRLAYDGVDGSRQQTDAVLDWTAHKGRLFIEQKTIHHAAKALQEIKSTLGTWTEGPRGGLAAFVRDGDAKDAARADRDASARAAHDALVERLRPKAPSGEHEAVGTAKQVPEERSSSDDSEVE